MPGSACLMIILLLCLRLHEWPEVRCYAFRILMCIEPHPAIHTIPGCDSGEWEEGLFALNCWSRMETQSIDVVLHAFTSRGYASFSPTRRLLSSFLLGIL